MFTGLVEGIGTISNIEQLEDAVRLSIELPGTCSEVGLGDSVSVQGVCLTVAALHETTMTADVMLESLRRSNLAQLAVGDAVNLERAMSAGGRFGGHIVQGHVDATVTVLERTPSTHWEVFRCSLPRHIQAYVVEKGSITLNGTSLTISTLGELVDGDSWFEVSLIPTTLQDTTFGQIQPGDALNVEVDVLAKYVERMLQGAHLGITAPLSGLADAPRGTVADSQD